MDSCTFVSISHKVSSNETDSAVANAKKLGFEIITTTHSDPFYDIWAGSPDHRKACLEDVFASSTKLIWAYKGGSGSIHILDDLNFEQFEKDPKLFLGYSDLTPLLNLIYERTGMVALHGPNAVWDIDSTSRKYLKSALKMENFSFQFENYSSSSDSVSGVLKGGNLAMLSWSLSSSFQIDLNNKVVFFEDIGTTDAIAYNRLVQLKNSGFLKPKAILFGYLQNVRSIKSFIVNVSSLFPDVPIVYNLPIGHKQPNITLPIGARVQIDFKKKNIKVLFPKKLIKYRCYHD